MPLAVLNRVVFHLLMAAVAAGAMLRAIPQNARTNVLFLDNYFGDG
jgi:hypothetical protein